MTTDLDRAVRSSLGDIIATAPEPDDQPMQLGGVGSETRTRRPYLAVAASLVVLAGVGALVAISTNDATPVAPAAAPIATDDSSAAEPVPAPTTTTVLGDTSPSCAITGAQALVPNVAGMPWGDAAAVLTTEGLLSNPIPELPAPFETPDSDYVIIRQATSPGTITPCGTIVDITVAYRPGTLYVVQEGDTYESIANSQSITLEQLLGFNGLSLAELEAAGRSPAAPLALGQALRLSSCPTSGACSGPSNDLATPDLDEQERPSTTLPLPSTTVVPAISLEPPCSRQGPGGDITDSDLGNLSAEVTTLSGDTVGFVVTDSSTGEEMVGGCMSASAAAISRTEGLSLAEVVPVRDGVFVAVAIPEGRELAIPDDVIRSRSTTSPAPTGFDLVILDAERLATLTDPGVSVSRLQGFIANATRSLTIATAALDADLLEAA